MRRRSIVDALQPTTTGSSPRLPPESETPASWVREGFNSCVLGFGFIRHGVMEIFRNAVAVEKP